jgi:hypothetical protein
MDELAQEEFHDLFTSSNLVLINNPLHLAALHVSCCLPCQETRSGMCTIVMLTNVPAISAYKFHFLTAYDSTVVVFA